MVLTFTGSLSAAESGHNAVRTMAWPANYGVTGIQTFLVSHDGIVYQKDLGPETAKLVAGIKAYNPDKSWIVTEDDRP